MSNEEITKTGVVICLNDVPVLDTDKTSGLISVTDTGLTRCPFHPLVIYK